MSDSDIDIKEIKPITFYDEMAEMGFLGEYLTMFFADKLNNDYEFRDKMIAKLLLSSKEASENVENLLLEQLSASLGKFLEGIKEWTQKSQ